jgi:hypothetical protein
MLSAVLTVQEVEAVWFSSCNEDILRGSVVTDAVKGRCDAVPVPFPDAVCLSDEPTDAST